MGFLAYIERLRGRSERERMGIAFGLSAGITGVIALMWLGTIIARSDTTEVVQTSAATAESFTSQLDTLKEQLNSSYEAVRSGVDLYTSAEATDTEDSTEEASVGEIFGEQRAF